MEVLTKDVVDEILKRVPVKALGRLKCVSKQWKSTIESKTFQEKQVIHRQQSMVPDVLFVYDPDHVYFRNYNHSNYISSSSSVTVVEFPIKKTFHCSNSCDGLVCLYKRRYVYQPSIVMNPTTGWQRTLPPSKLQLQRSSARTRHNLPSFGFGKDKFNATYKIVWLYNNSREFNLPEATTTTCEVFDFSTNGWRYVTPSSPFEIIARINPPYVDGSLHWFTKCKQAKVLSFDLHTETFQVIAKAPFDHAHRYGITMRNMNNRLCVSVTKWPNQVIIWSFDSYSKTWNEIYSIDSDWSPRRQLSPVTVLDEKNKKMNILFYDSESSRDLVIYDGQTESYDLEFKSKFYGYPVCYFQSLISI